MSGCLNNIQPILLLLSVLLLTTVCHAAPDFLSPEEQAWLDSHPIISVGMDPDAAPFEFLDSQGRYKGLSVDYLSVVAETLGVSFEPVKARNWAELMEMAQQKKVDLLPTLVASENRRKFLTFTSPWFSVPGVVLSARECGGVEELSGKTVAVVQGSIWDDYFSSHPVDVKLIRVEDLRTAVELTAMSGVYAMVTNLAFATEMIHQLGISNLRIVLRLEEQTNLSIGVRDDWPELVSILNKTLAAMDPVLKDELRHRWLNLGEIPGWRWQDSSVVRIGLIVLGIFIGIIVFFIIWNISLKRQVRKRSQALERAQRSLIRAAKMESVGQLAAGVAHEVKNPLAIISMGVEFMSSDPERNDGDREILTDMGDAVQRADKVIRGLLDYAHYSKLDRAPGDLNEIIQRSLHLVEHEMKKHRINVHTDLAPLKTALVDGNRMQQVFINLFMNSVQAMDNGGRLDIVSRMHRLSPVEAERSKEYVPGTEVIRVTVSDTGHGIEEGSDEKIFDPFYTTKDVGRGTGLGLSESRNIMELHNGTLHLTNCTDKGACAVLILPCERTRRLM